MINSISPPQKFLKIFILLIALSPFLPLPLIASLKYFYNNQASPYLSRYKILLLTVGSLIALTMSLKPTQFLSKSELLAARLLPPEISSIILSAVESNRVTALSSYEIVTTPIAVAKIQKLRLQYHPEFSSNMGINPNGIFRILPLGFAWIRGAPAHAALLLHYHFIARK